MTFDVAVVGGSYAGLSAALQLARARRRLLVIDGGKRRNRFADSSHGFLTQDGSEPGEIAAKARGQLMKYPTVTWIDAQADDAERLDAGFSIAAGPERFETRRVVLATGVKDELPDVPGLAERWGRSVFHCPYCHGYELNQGRIGVLGIGPMSVHHALMLPDWGETTLLLHGGFEPEAAQLAQLERRGVAIERGAIARLTGERASVEMKDGRTIPFEGMFTLTRTSVSSPLAQQLGCELEEGPLGPFVRTDALKQTSVPGVYACGDAGRAMGSVALAVGDGAVAGAAAHQSLIFAAH
jgi:thioredoxin reductase